MAGQQYLNSGPPQERRTVSLDEPMKVLNAIVVFGSRLGTAFSLQCSIMRTKGAVRWAMSIATSCETGRISVFDAHTGSSLITIQLIPSNPVWRVVLSSMRHPPPVALRHRNTIVPTTSADHRSDVPLIRAPEASRPQPPLDVLLLPGPPFFDATIARRDAGATLCGVRRCLVW